jgi:hypothetical protein
MIWEVQTSFPASISEQSIKRCRGHAIPEPQIEDLWFENADTGNMVS